MKRIKWLFEMAYYKRNYKSEGQRDPWPVIGYCFCVMLAFVFPVLYVLVGEALAANIGLFVLCPIMVVGAYSYFYSHHDEIMNNVEYINAPNRRKIFNISVAICAIGVGPLGLLNIFLLEKLLYP